MTTSPGRLLIETLRRSHNSFFCLHVLSETLLAKCIGISFLHNPNLNNNNNNNNQLSYEAVQSVDVLGLPVTSADVTECAALFRSHLDFASTVAYCVEHHVADRRFGVTLTQAGSFDPEREVREGVELITDIFDFLACPRPAASSFHSPFTSTTVIPSSHQSSANVRNNNNSAWTSVLEQMGLPLEWSGRLVEMTRVRVFRAVTLLLLRGLFNRTEIDRVVNSSNINNNSVVMTNINTENDNNNNHNNNSAFLSQMQRQQQLLDQREEQLRREADDAVAAAFSLMDSPDDIRAFVNKHAPLSAATAPEACLPFPDAEAHFLRTTNEGLLHDAMNNYAADDTISLLQILVQDAKQVLAAVLDNENNYGNSNNANGQQTNRRNNINNNNNGQTFSLLHLPSTTYSGLVALHAFLDCVVHPPSAPPSAASASSESSEADDGAVTIHDAVLELMMTATSPIAAPAAGAAAAPAAGAAAAPSASPAMSPHDASPSPQAGGGAVAHPPCEGQRFSPLLRSADGSFNSYPAAASSADGGSGADHSQQDQNGEEERSSSPRGVAVPQHLQVLLALLRTPAAAQRERVVDVRLVSSAEPQQIHQQVQQEAEDEDGLNNNQQQQQGAIEPAQAWALRVTWRVPRTISLRVLVQRCVQHLVVLSSSASRCVRRSPEPYRTMALIELCGFPVARQTLFQATRVAPVAEASASRNRRAAFGSHEFMQQQAQQLHAESMRSSGGGVAVPPAKRRPPQRATAASASAASPSSSASTGVLGSGSPSHRRPVRFSNRRSHRPSSSSGSPRRHHASPRDQLRQQQAQQEEEDEDEEMSHFAARRVSEEVRLLVSDCNSTHMRKTAHFFLMLFPKQKMQKVILRAGGGGRAAADRSDGGGNSATVSGGASSSSRSGSASSSSSGSDSSSGGDDDGAFSFAPFFTHREQRRRHAAASHPPTIAAAASRAASSAAAAAHSATTTVRGLFDSDDAFSRLLRDCGTAETLKSFEVLNPCAVLLDAVSTRDAARFLTDNEMDVFHNHQPQRGGVKVTLAEALLLRLVRSIPFDVAGSILHFYQTSSQFFGATTNAASSSSSSSSTTRRAEFLSSSGMFDAFALLVPWAVLVKALIAISGCAVSAASSPAGSTLFFAQQQQQQHQQQASAGNNININNYNSNHVPFASSSFMFAASLSNGSAVLMNNTSNHSHHHVDPSFHPQQREEENEQQHALPFHTRLQAQQWADAILSLLPNIAFYALHLLELLHVARSKRDVTLTELGSIGCLDAAFAPRTAAADRPVTSDAIRPLLTLVCLLSCELPSQGGRLPLCAPLERLVRCLVNYSEIADTNWVRVHGRSLTLLRSVVLGSAGVAQQDDARRAAAADGSDEEEEEEEDDEDDLHNHRGGATRTNGSGVPSATEVAAAVVAASSSASPARELHVEHDSSAAELEATATTTTAGVAKRKRQRRYHDDDDEQQNLWPVFCQKSSDVRCALGTRVSLALLFLLNDGVDPLLRMRVACRHTSNVLRAALDAQVQEE